MRSITIYGGGAWGTALGIVAEKSGNKVKIYSRNTYVVDSINQEHENKVYLPNIKLPESIKATDRIYEIHDSDYLVIAVPAQKLREVCIDLAKCELSVVVPLIVCSKGIEIKTHKIMSEIVNEILPSNHVAILSGPNFAEEVALGKPAGTTIACSNAILGEKIVSLLGNNLFRTYFNQDIISVQIAGALKNVIAIACGIAAGKDMGDNAVSALIARGLAEIKKVAIKKGGRVETLLGLAGVGDMILTCTNEKSRNMSFGYKLGKVGSVDDLPKQEKLVEGVSTALAISTIAEAENLDLPICDAVNKIVNLKMPIDRIILDLMNRPLVWE